MMTAMGTSNEMQINVGRKYKSRKERPLVDIYYSVHLTVAELL